MHESPPAALAIEDRVRKIIETVIPKDEVYIVEILVRGHQGSKVVEVYLDADSGVGLDQLASFSREAGFLMEAEDVIKGRYRLNVSSPGADRPIRMARQLKKHVGRKLALRLEDGGKLQGNLISVDGDRVAIEKGNEEVNLTFDRIQEAKVVLPW